MENGPFEDVFPIKHGEIPASYVSETQRVRLVHFDRCLSCRDQLRVGILNR